MRNPEQVATVERPDGVQLALRVYNSAARHAVVLSNALACDDRFWRHVIDDLALDHCVVTWDYRGQGDSTRPQGPGAFSLAAHVADLAAVQVAVGAATAVHFGFGIGAMVALAHGQQSPAAVEALVLIQGGGPAGGATGGATLLAPLGARLVRGLWNHRLQRLVHRTARRFRLVGPTCAHEDLGVLVDGWARQPLSSQCHLLRGLSSAEVTGHTTAVPTLLLSSRDDVFCSDAWSQRLHELLPQSEYERLPGATHAALLELGPLIAHRARRFMADHRGPREWGRG
jgi:pimeloyl-ACP methyl ester carboxylesterase